MQPDEPVFPKPKEFIRTNFVWFLGLIPIALAAIKLLTVSRGNWELFGFLLRDLNVLQLILGTIMPLVPLAAFWVWIAWVDWIHRVPTSVRYRVVPEWADNQLFNGILFVAALMPLAHLLFSMAILIIQLGIRRRKSKKAELRWGAGHGTRLVPVYEQFRNFALGFFIAALTSTSGMWYPPELVKIKGSGTQAGYVIAYDRDWTTFVDDKKNIEIFKTELIESRTPCIATWSLMSRPILKLLTKNPPAQICLP